MERSGGAGQRAYVGGEEDLSLACRDGGFSWDPVLLVPDPDPTGSCFDHALTTR